MTQPTLGGYDAAWAPTSPPVTDTVVMGYLGGDTPHPWSLADWLSQPARYRIGIWTRDNPQGAAEGTSEGRLAASMWKALGATPGSLMVLDYETAVDSAYVQAFDSEVVAAGFKLALYGSKSSVFQNYKPSGGYFPADLTGQPHLYPGTLLTQYKFENDWDDDTIASSVVLWDTRPADPPSTSKSVRLNDMHIDLQLNKATIFTNPAAVLGGTSHLCLSTDFGPAKVRVAAYSFATGGWTVSFHDLTPTGGALSLPLPADTNKVNVEVTEGNAEWPVGLDVFA